MAAVTMAIQDHQTKINGNSDAARMIESERAWLSQQIGLLRTCKEQNARRVLAAMEARLRILEVRGKI